LLASLLHILSSSVVPMCYFSTSNLSWVATLPKLPLVSTVLVPKLSKMLAFLIPLRLSSRIPRNLPVTLLAMT